MAMSSFILFLKFIFILKILKVFKELCRLLIIVAIMIYFRILKIKGRLRCAALFSIMEMHFDFDLIRCLCV